MAILRAAAAALAWLGRQGTRAIAAVVLIGIAVPPLGAVLRPFVTPAIFALLAIAFMRVDTAALRSYVRRPTLVLAATAWTMLAIPLLSGAACLALRLDARAPELLLALMLQALAPPMMAAPAFAALMGFDATLVLATLVTSTALTPVTAPLFAYGLIGPTLALSPTLLGLKLFAILAGSALVAVIGRRLLGPAAIARRKHEIDGINIVVVFVFVAAVMEHAAANFIDAPMATIGLSALAFAVSIAVLAVTAAVFAWAGAERAFVLGLMASQRNMGLMLAATGGALPDFVWLYFALCQFPIYLFPQLLKPLARRLAGRAPVTRGTL
ncbi:MAG TPA: Na+-dependent transporter [Xanthobacteraceae bacterium]|nr:Na+-dependent transporter [Xanthobacteraceae bacterium]